MKQRFGALLSMALGAVLVTTGLSDSSGGVIGGPPPDCGSISVGLTIPCPTGTIAITKTTILPPGSTATPPPGGWKVDITSTCLDPATAAPVSMTVSVPDNATGTSGDLFVYTNETHGTKCHYVLSEEPVAGFTGVFDPTSPVHLPFGGGRTGNDLKVSLTNTAEVITTSPTPTTTAPSSDTPSPSASISSTVIIDSFPPVSATPIANTGPHEQIRSSVYIGIALLLLGFVMLVAGTVQRRRGRHI